MRILLAVFLLLGGLVAIGLSGSLPVGSSSWMLALGMFCLVVGNLHMTNGIVKHYTRN